MYEKYSQSMPLCNYTSHMLSFSRHDTDYEERGGRSSLADDDLVLYINPTIERPAID